VMAQETGKSRRKMNPGQDPTMSVEEPRSRAPLPRRFDAIVPSDLARNRQSPIARGESVIVGVAGERAREDACSMQLWHQGVADAGPSAVGGPRLAGGPCTLRHTLANGTPKLQLCSRS